MLSDSLNAKSILNAKWYILWDSNIDISRNCTMFKEKNKNIVKDRNKMLSEAREYLEFCQIFQFKQVIQSQLELHITYPPLLLTY